MRTRVVVVLPFFISLLVLLSMPLLFRYPTGELSSSEGLTRLGEAVTLVDSLVSEGPPGSPLMRLIIRLDSLIPDPLTP